MEESLDSQLSIFIQDLVLDHYEKSSIFDKARPSPKEWTVLAGIVVENTITQEFFVGSIATGTKSIPRSCMNKDGYCLNDCHAEILAR